MNDLQDKITQLEQEIKNIDGIAIDAIKSKNIALGIAVASPFITFALLYATGFEFCCTDEKVDRKKVLKWSALLTVILWIGLFVFASIRTRQGL